MMCLIARRRRPHHTRFISYHDNTVPTEPNASAVHILQRKRVSPAAIDEIKKVLTVYTLYPLSTPYMTHNYLMITKLECCVDVV